LIVDGSHAYPALFYISIEFSLSLGGVLFAVLIVAVFRSTMAGTDRCDEQGSH
jgi:hypothetical protein